MNYWGMYAFGGFYDFDSLHEVLVYYDGEVAEAEVGAVDLLESYGDFYYVFFGYGLLDC